MAEHTFQSLWESLQLPPDPIDFGRRTHEQVVLEGLTRMLSDTTARGDPSKQAAEMRMQQLGEQGQQTLRPGVHPLQQLFRSLSGLAQGLIEPMSEHGLPNYDLGVVPQPLKGLRKVRAALRGTPIKPNEIDRRINERDVVYHSTYIDQLMDILREGIKPIGGREFTGVSTARIPEISYVQDRPVTLVLDKSKLPRSRPYASKSAPKVKQRTGYTISDKDAEFIAEKTGLGVGHIKAAIENADPYQSGPLMDELNKRYYGSKEVLDLPALSSMIQPYLKTKPNPHFEYETRTLGRTPQERTIKPEAIKRVLIDPQNAAKLKSGFGDFDEQLTFLADKTGMSIDEIKNVVGPGLTGPTWDHFSYAYYKHPDSANFPKLGDLLSNLYYLNRNQKQASIPTNIDPPVTFTSPGDQLKKLFTLLGPGAPKQGRVSDISNMLKPEPLHPDAWDMPEPLYPGERIKIGTLEDTISNLFKYFKNSKGFQDR